MHKKNDRKECNNSREISLLSIPEIVYKRILPKRLRQYVGEAVAEEQKGFRAGKDIINQLFAIQQLSEKYFGRNRTLYNNFMDFRHAFDSVCTGELRNCGGSGGIIIRSLQQVRECS